MTQPTPRPTPRQVSGRARRLLRRLLRLSAWLSLAGVVLGVCVLIAAWLVPLPERLAVVDSTVVEYRDGTPAHVFLSPDEKWRMGRPLAKIDPAYLVALIRLEDKRFRSHLGVDPIAILRSTTINLRRGRVVTGASTITMQLARLLEPRPRTLRSKLIEAFRAFQLELNFSKDEVLEHYLRFVPYGRNVEGIEAASWAYFGHSAEALTPAEIATLLAVPQGPTSRHPRADHEGVLRRARDEIGARLLADGVLPTGRGGRRSTDAAVLADIEATPVPTGFRRFPREASHLANWLRARFPHRLRIRTTIDRGLQRLAERTVGGAAARLARQGIHNGAAVVVDHRTGEARALVGALDAAAPGGQIPAFASVRSSGSTLKPVIYALAIDRGLALPEFLVEDAPARFGQWAPSNYDGRYEGLVRLEAALSRSLNLPFVHLLRRLGLETLLGALRAMDARHLVDRPGYYGLSAALGAIEISLLELTGMYATLARGGSHRPLIVTPSAVGAPVTIYSPGAAWLTRRALKGKGRPDFPRQRQLAGLPRQIHWKTGTSTGHRDAWAVGSGPHYTAGVWLGNLDNTPSKALVGAEAAGPILFDLLEGIADPLDLSFDDPRPDDLVPVELCAFSGYPVNDACPSRVIGWACAANVPIERDPFHVHIEVDLASGRAVTPICKGDRKTVDRVFIVWPPNAKRYLSTERRTLPEPPPWAEGCEPTGSGVAAPQITSPPARHTVMLIPGVPADRQEVPLEADSRTPGDELSWFVDGRFIGTVRAGKRVWWTPKVGLHHVVVTDSRGQSSRRELRVR